MILFFKFLLLAAKLSVLGKTFQGSTSNFTFESPLTSLASKTTVRNILKIEPQINALVPKIDGRYES